MRYCKVPKYKYHARTMVSYSSGCVCARRVRIYVVSPHVPAVRWHLRHARRRRLLPGALWPVRRKIVRVARGWAAELLREAGLVGGARMQPARAAVHARRRCGSRQRGRALRGSPPELPAGRPALAQVLPDGAAARGPHALLLRPLQPLARLRARAEVRVVRGRPAGAARGRAGRARGYGGGSAARARLRAPTAGRAGAAAPLGRRHRVALLVSAAVAVASTTSAAARSSDSSSERREWSRPSDAR